MVEPCFNLLFLVNCDVTVKGTVMYKLDYVSFMNRKEQQDIHMQKLLQPWVNLGHEDFRFCGLVRICFKALTLPS